MSYYYLLKKQGINCLATEATLDEFANYPMPAIVHIKENGGMFLLINDIDEENVFFVSEVGESEKMPIEYFRNVWTGRMLIFDTDHIEVHPRIFIDRVKQWFTYSCVYIAFFSMVGLLLGIFIYSWEQRDIYNLLFTLFYMIGGLFSSLLLIREFSRNNLWVNKICHSKSGNEKIDCSSILDSKAAYFVGLFSWTDFGFVYFLSLFLLVFSLPGELTRTIIVVLSLLSFPYVFYSIFYQMFVHKWCRLCLGVQCVLLALFLLSLVALPTMEFSALLNWQILFVIFISITVISIFTLLKKTIRVSLDFNVVNIKYKALKYNDEVIRLMFERQSFIDSSALEKIVLSPAGKDCITVVFNTVCSPCMRELRNLLEFYRIKKETRLEFIFLLSEDNNTESHLIAKSLLKQYYTDSASFVSFFHAYSTTYPADAKRLTKIALTEYEHTKFGTIIQKHTQWCEAHGISTTPCVFFNGRLLPDGYSLQDVDYMSV